MQMRLLPLVLMGACAGASLVDSGGVDSDPTNPNSFTNTPDTDSDTDTTATDDPCVATEGLAGAALSAVITDWVSAQDCNSYVEATTFMFTELDKVNNEVECVYTGRKTAVFNTKPDATDMNTEHSWPQSLGADAEPAKCDVHHLYPTDANANSRRGSYPFGMVTGSVDWQEGGSKLGSGAGGTVFEPRDVHKGNVARSMIYFAHRYGFPIDAAQMAIYKQWHLTDPVDDAEVVRSLAIGAEQVLPNPFVLCADLVGRVD